MENNGKVALITGANKGIGFETAKQLGELGYTILVGSRDTTRGQEAVAKLTELGINAQLVQLDVSSKDSIHQAAKSVASKFDKLDALINNAAVKIDDYSTKTSEVGWNTFEKTFQTNLFGLAETVTAFLPLIKQSEAGRIVNLTSILASNTLHGDPKSPIYDAKVPAYDISKTAVNAYTVHLAHELRKTNIKVNAANPGWVKTDMGGENAPMELADGAKTSVKLATLPEDGPTGKFIHMDEELPW
jgi:NAD(P)-dependent dehydrogenase (short-subunit alcohol dehydrogenase family)